MKRKGYWASSSLDNQDLQMDGVVLVTSSKINFTVGFKDLYRACKIEQLQLHQFHELKFKEERVRWEFPKERFVTYEPSDERWCRYFGIGREIRVRITTKIPHALLVGFDPKTNTFTFEAYPEGNTYEEEKIEIKAPCPV